MIRNIFLSLCSALALTCPATQVTTDRFDLGYPDRAALSIPKEFSYDGTPKLILYETGSSTTNWMRVFNENLEMTDEIRLDDRVFNYQLTYRDEARNITSINEVNTNVSCQFKSYDDFIQSEKNLNPNFNESQLIIIESSNGDKKISLDYGNDRYTNNKRMYFAFDRFGYKYPKVYFIVSNNAVTGYRANYEVTYSDWVTLSTHTEDCSAKLQCMQLCNVNLNHGDGKADSFFMASQTLFNKDNRYEYIMPKFKLSAKGNVSSNPDVNFGNNEENEIVDSRTVVASVENELALAGFQILENGSVVADLDFEDGFEGYITTDYAYVVTIGNSVYLAFNGSNNGEQSTIFYKINRDAGSVDKVKVIPSSMSVFPSVANQGCEINVKFNDENEMGSEIIVTSATGMCVANLQVAKNKKSTPMHLNALSGIYFVSRIQNGQITETKRIILK